MKQCPKCGKMLNDTMAFCTQCGTPLANAAAQPAPQPTQQPVWPASQPAQSAPQFTQQPTQQRYYAPAQAAYAPANPVLNTVRQMATSPLFLAATAAQSGMVLFNIIASMAGTSGLLGTVGAYLSMILRLGGYSSREASGLLDGIGSLFTGASLGATLVGQCPAILIAVGLWLIYLAETGKISASTRNTGMTLVKVSTIISLVVSVLGLVVSEVLAIMITATAAKYDDSAIGGGIIIMLLLLVVLGLGVLMHLKTLSTLGVMQQTLQTAQPSDKVSTYVAVISFLNGIGAVLGMLGFGSVPSVLSDLCSAVACICFAVFLFQYRDKMRALMAGRTAQTV